MTANRRIFWNIVATYGRSLFALCCGLFGSRWVLMVLGQEDFGLYGVVGGLVIFIGIINMLLESAVSVGAAEVHEARNGENKVRRRSGEDGGRWGYVMIFVAKVQVVMIFAVLRQIFFKYFPTSVLKYGIICANDA